MDLISNADDLKSKILDRSSASSGRSKKQQKALTKDKKIQRLTETSSAAG